jgi:hypothetical protein
MLRYPRGISRHLRSGIACTPTDRAHDADALAERCGSMSTATAMTLPDQSRSFLATIVGWVLAAIVVWLALRLLFGTLGFLVRGFILTVVIVGLLWAYLALKAPND